MNNESDLFIHSDSVTYLEGQLHAQKPSPEKKLFFGKLLFGTSGSIELPSNFTDSIALEAILGKSIAHETIQNAFKTLVSIEFFENFLHTKYVGQKRFSIEGCDTAIVFLDQLVRHAQSESVREIVLGMSHRGRLNAMYHVLHKPLEKIFLEFEGVENGSTGTGDVKYHKGYTRVTPHCRMQLVDNPSHLESVYPVVEGAARGYIDSGLSQAEVLPIVFHGDAAFAGQGVVYETLQLHKLPPYQVGGTIHVIIDNKIGFTATPNEFESMQSCTDIAYAFQIPVLHVNVDDIVGCLKAVEVAYWMRTNLKIDVIVDIIGVRKWGHNESDEPSFTSPQLYSSIRKQTHFRKRIEEQLVQDGSIAFDVLEKEERALKDLFLRSYEHMKATLSDIHHVHGRISEDRLFDTRIPADELNLILEDLLYIPPDFSFHHGLLRQIEHRLEKFKKVGLEMELDFGLAELVAFSSLCRQKIPVRLIGQDTPRGTFSHRHALWIDQTGERIYSPVRRNLENPHLFQVWNSSLSENAALAFEYGYSLARLDALVVWEAQFGDFANGAQVVIDQYIASSEQKWGKASRVTLLLPHGYEGQGPEHSSCRLERFLQLSANNNWVIAQPSTPMQYLKLLLRQAHSTKPLVVLTPKSLLRNPACLSKAIEATQSEFQKVLWDQKSDPQILVLCSGKVFYDMASKFPECSFVRIEQLYPFPQAEISQIFFACTHLKKVIWLQEEPENMGANWFVHENLQLPEGCSFVRICRPPSTASASGLHHLHDEENAALFETLRNHMSTS